jgi:hypothetical protein
MKIREMRSASSHLSTKMESQRPDQIREIRTMVEAELEPAPAPPIPVNPLSELDEGRWAVISFRRIEVTGLTFDQAKQWLAELDLQGVSGLCLITDDAAARSRS